MVKKKNTASGEIAGRDAVLDSIADGVFTVDRDWKIAYFNRAAEKITGVKRDEAIGRHCFEVFRANICEDGCRLRQSIESGEATVNQSAYIVRGDGKRIPISISTAVLKDNRGVITGGVETFRDLSVIETLRKELKQRYSFHDIVSKNMKMLELFKILPQVAFSDSSVLIEGESGTGKELVARAIHGLSRRAEGPLVSVNCAALPDSLLESELFGHMAGAFTDAKKDRPGRFTLADGGTIFLDEIGDISPAMQVRLLRVLQEKTFEPLGGTKTHKVDVRVLAASNRNLYKLVEGGSFRKDLFYRINIVTLSIPPLRERREDVPLLVEHFIEHFNRLRGKEVSHISPEAMQLLMRHPFEGNVRELANIIEHAFVLCPGGILMPEHLPERFRDHKRSGPQAGSLQEIEAQQIRAALERNGYNRALTAAELGIHKTTLWRKMKKLGLSNQNS
ncbi:MAG TPA: sigma 54-interacting transcriptional regulator [Myxococcota bacterium]|nr:sigma 54-interacting transcriptional regulator [Myxococcota bacterium]